MGPVSREGRLVVIAFVAMLLAGGVLFGIFMFAGMPAIGILLFVTFAIAAGAGFIAIANFKGDHTRTVADCRQGGISPAAATRPTSEHDSMPRG
jgi:hypothetical protein